MLKKSFFSHGTALALALLFCLAALPAGANELGDKPTDVSDVNGLVWLESDRESQLSYLLGVETAIAMEQALTYARAERTGTDPVFSPFQQGWSSAFENTSRSRLASDLDKFYRDNPTQRNRHVFDVIWTEMIVPVAGRR